MEFYVDNDGLARLEADLRASTGVQRLALLVRLAWLLRERDSVRAAQLADEGISLLPQSDLLPDERRQLQARLLLIQSFVMMLKADFKTSKTLLQKAMQGFAAANDVIGYADAHMLAGVIAFDQGDNKGVITAFKSMAQATEKHDPARYHTARAILLHSALVAGRLSEQQYQEQLALLQQDSFPLIARCWVDDFLGRHAAQASDFAQATHHHMHGYTAALESGQMRNAITNAVAVGHILTQLNEHQPALEWIQRAMTLARRGNWPFSLGMALLQTADTLFRLQRHDEAWALLQEALQTMVPLTGSRLHAQAMCLLGDMELERKEYDLAATTFQRVQQRAAKLAHSELESMAFRGQAHALSRLDQGQAALLAAQAALSLADNPVSQIAALQVKAEIHAHHILPAPKNMQAASVPLHFLHQAQDLAATIEGFTVSASLLDDMAREYAKLGLYHEAWEIGQQANEVRQKTLSREATLRASAMQLNRQTEQARLEAEHLRQLARSESERAETLQKNSETLARLGVIGLEITACLEAERIFQVLDRHVHHLLNVSAFEIWLLAKDGQTLARSFGIAQGQLLSACELALSAIENDIVRAILERREISLDLEPSPPAAALAGSLQPLLPTTLSRLFAPLYETDQVIGAITIQSFQAHAYGEREELIFRTLCAYTAIALANADAHGELASAHTRLEHAHRQLQDTQQQMILQGKMAGLGTLTAGVAHEINNPTNFVHVAAQNQREDIGEFRQYVDSMIEADDAPEIVQGFHQRFAKLSMGVSTMLNGTERIKGIVKDLRAFTRQGDANKKAVRLSECLTSTLNLVRTSWLEKVEFITDFACDPEIECWPALLNQVFMNLLVNACQAIEEKQCAHFQRDNSHPAEPGAPLCLPRGTIRLTLKLAASRMHIDIEDNGIGIGIDAQARILEPFYTTKPVGSGTGLGLSIAFGIVEKHGGKLSFTSTPGVGTCFTIQLPLHH
jgi:signal transduction histidine kinase/tetratricopeptide (TPR) repeat protein